MEWYYGDLIDAIQFLLIIAMVIIIFYLFKIRNIKGSGGSDDKSSDNKSEIHREEDS